MFAGVDLGGKRILVTGGAGFVGGPVCRRLRERGAAAVIVPRRREGDLTSPDAVARLMESARPELVIHLAAEVGGIGANRAAPGRFFYANMAMGLNLIEASRRFEVPKFVQVGTVCSYPKVTRIPFREENLWDGYPEPTNAPYGLAKKALLVMLQAYRQQYGMNGIYLIPVNLYGPGDNFDPATSHVIPALIRKCEAARVGARARVLCWGTGRATREFLYVDDCAEAIVRAAERYDGPEPVNLGSGQEISVAELAQTIADVTGFEGELAWDPSHPDGQPRRLVDGTRAREELGFTASMPLREGLRHTVAWYRERAGLAASAAV
jgi:GDP-L-fucose synthase